MTKLYVLGTLFSLLSVVLVTAAYAEPVCDAADLAVTSTPAPPRSAGTMRTHLRLLSRIVDDVDAIAIGDSIVQNWPDAALKRALNSSRVLNLGVGADRVQSILWRLEAPQLAKLRPRRVMLLVGTNNLAPDKPCAIAHGTGVVVDRINALWHPNEIVLIEVLPRGPNLTGYAEARAQLRNHIESLKQGRPNLRIMNLDSVLICSAPEQCIGYKPDLLHLTPTGYELLSEALRASLK